MCFLHSLQLFLFEILCMFQYFKSMFGECYIRFAKYFKSGKGLIKCNNIKDVFKKKYFSYLNAFFFFFKLKHCSRYIHDLFPSLIKNLDPVPLRHLLNLVSTLHPSAHTEQVKSNNLKQSVFCGKSHW